MADQFPTGVAVPGGASYQSPLLDFSTIGNLPQTYDEADKAAAARDTRNAFRNGIPKIAGTTIPDYGAMADTLAKARAPVAEVTSLANQGLGWQLYRDPNSLNAAPGSPGATVASPGGPQSDAGDYLTRSKQVESGGNPNATASTTSAKGLYGFTDQTRADVAAKHGINPSDDEGLMKAFTADNATKLQQYGIPVTDRNLRLAHFLGADGAVAFLSGLKQDPNAPATSLVSPQAAAANQSTFFAGGKPVTAAQAYGKITGGFGGGMTADIGGGAPAQQGGQQTAQVGRRDAEPVDVTAPAGAPQVRQPGVPQKVAPFNQPGAETPASALVPPAWVGHEQQYADMLNRRAQAMAMIPGGMGKAELERLAAQAKTITDALAEGAKLTPTQKDYQSDRRPGESMSAYQARAAGEKKIAEDDVTAYQKRYTAIQSLGDRPRPGSRRPSWARG